MLNSILKIVLNEIKKILLFMDFLKEVEIMLYCILDNYIMWKILWKGLKVLLSIFCGLNCYMLGFYL